MLSELHVTTDSLNLFVLPPFFALVYWNCSSVILTTDYGMGMIDAVADAVVTAAKAVMADEAETVKDIQC